MGNYNGTRTCSHCGTPGHDIRTCPVSINAGRCSNCGYAGHDRRNCPEILNAPRRKF